MPARLPYSYKYLRSKKKFPHVWCPGCGIGIVMGSIIRAIDSLGWELDDILMVSGIGCTSRMPVYVDFNTLHTTHGRALAFGTGAKMANPKLKVLAVMGDGDSMAIGGNHIIHAARRNMDITAIIVNNNNYGMTGGQFSPTTPQGAKTATTPYGMIEPDFDVCKLTEAAGANFVARGDVYHVIELDGIIKKALSGSGFRVVETLSPCPTNFGRANKQGDAVNMMELLRDETINIAQASKLPKEKTQGKTVRGIFVDRDGMGYTERYQKLCDRVSPGVKK
ncbi:MAG: 2-oxoacid:ferredoxin oxidoreductase subunit beta [Gemmatimonadaceae bacterium 4484_173]|nr:MAG: 2-oxoacid:ferredoxin oxidoreductase subunit beta [Gemmatimonadaceae bacterium 4484_173]RKZ03848.1 MAG: 2-oxoacid:ferredoxin oxidoreductase subunit beta [Candidatus Fermentibacteria bacterium]